MKTRKTVHRLARGAHHGKGTIVIEELQDYLIRHGLSEDIASEVHDAYYESMPKACKYARSLNDEKHDYVPEIVELILNWRREVGEAYEHITEYVAKAARIVRSHKGWFVDAITYDGHVMRYTVLGATPYAIREKAEAEQWARDIIDVIIDNGAWMEVTNG